MLDKYINNYYVSNVLYCVIFIILSIIVMKNMKEKNHVNLKEKLSFKQIKKSLLLSYIFLTLGSTILTYQLFEHISNFVDINFTSAVEPINLIMVMVAFISTCIFAPITEEIVFRFGLLEFFKKKSNTVFALIVSSTIFAILHLYNIDGFILTFLLGLICGISYIKTNNLLYPIIIHFVFNLHALLRDYLVLDNKFKLYVGVFLLLVSIVMYRSTNKNTCKKQVL